MNFKNISCYYCKAQAQNRKINENNQRSCNDKPSEKSMVQCTFVIKYNYINFARSNKHQRFVLDLIVVFVNLGHTCQLNVPSLCETLKLFWPCKELHREEIEFALELLKNNPACD